MYGIYGDIINSAQRALESFEETQELLEYPEVQADKAYYLSVLSKYNNLNFLKDKLDALLAALENEKEYSALLREANSDEDRKTIYGEIYSLKRKASEISAALADSLGCAYAQERAYCRFKFKEGSAKFGEILYSLVKNDLLLRGAKIEDEKIVRASGGYVQDISFIAQGADAVARLAPLIGAHRVFDRNSKPQELRFAATQAASVEEISEDDLKIDVFHSRGAGGQNVNKVETAVRVTHLPTGLVVVCQDERSQLKNKRRALENMRKKLKELGEQAEKKRIEADVYAQHSKRNTPISFDTAGNTMSDTRLKAFSKIAFPLTQEQFGAYIDGLIAL